MKDTSRSLVPALALLELPANKLLDQFGGGNHVPGSGSAAALMGLLAAQLTLTVCKITSAKSEARPGELDYLALQMENRFIPRLQEMFQEDADAFDVVITNRRMRDAATDKAERRRWGERSNQKLREATELVMDIGDLCLALADHATRVFNQGAKMVRGDSGAAISSAIAGASTAIFIANLNLQSFQAGAWARLMQERINAMQADIISKQGKAFELASEMQVIALPDDQPSLFDARGSDDS